MTPQDLLKLNNILDLQLHEAYTRLGKIILLPFTDLNNFPPSPSTFAETQQAPYLRRLAESHVAVVLGPASGDLYAVCFESSDGANAFLNANPVAYKTAVFDHFDGRTFFFRIEGFAPRHVAWEGGQWLGSGFRLPLRVKEDSQERNVWATDCTPARIKFADFVWSQDVQRLFTPQLVEDRYGRPFYEGRKSPELNYAFWAHYYASENRVRFLPERGDFYHLASGSPGWTSLPLSELEADLLDWLLAQGRKPEFKLLQRPLDAAARKKLIRELKVVALGRLAGLEAGLKLFVAECLEKWPGGTISVRELYVVYSQFCRSRNFPILSEGRFQRMSPELIQLHYQSERSNSIPRPNGEVRGYRGIHTKLTIIEGGHATDGKAEEVASAKATTENREQNG